MNKLSFDIISSLNSAQWHSIPFTWAFIKKVTLDSFFKGIASTFPDSGFISGERKGDDSGHKKSYFLETRVLCEEEDTDLSPEWHDLISVLRSDEYKQALSDIIDIDLAGLDLELSIWRYPSGGWLAPHTDKEDKVVTQIFYLNPKWDSSWGGCLRILGSENEDDIFMEVPPLVNSSVVLVRSEESWHMVTKSMSTEESNNVRYALTAMFRRKTN